MNSADSPLLDEGQEILSLFVKIMVLPNCSLQWFEGKSAGAPGHFGAKKMPW